MHLEKKLGGNINSIERKADDIMFPSVLLCTHAILQHKGIAH